MNDHFSIKTGSVHLWRVILPEIFPEIDTLVELLSPDEKARAEQFKFAIHQKRFIAARGTLRKVLGLYTDIAPDQIVFQYGEYGKPFLSGNTALQFNVSHSEDIAVLALTNDQPIGVDIEKISEPFKADIAKRYFTAAEFSMLNELPIEEEKCRAFYQLWAQKEAAIKLFGEGIFRLDEVLKIKPPYLKEIDIYSGYAAAIATIMKIDEMIIHDS